MRVSFLAFALTLAVAGLPAAAIGETRAVVDGGHAAIQVNYDSGPDDWEIGIHVGGHDSSLPVLLPDEVVLVIGEAGRMVVPELSESWDFLGEEGDRVWISPSGTAPPELVRLGFNQWGVDDGVFTGGSGGMITQTMTGFDGPAGFFMYEASGGDPNVIYDTRLESPPYGLVDNLDAGGHRHYNWAFRSPGIYFLTLQASGTRLSDGVETISDPQTFAVLVEPRPVHWWLLEHFGEDANQPVAGLANDPSGDGVPNLLKYAFGLDPWSAAREGLPKIDFVAEEGATFPRISSRRPEGRDDLTYSIQYSGDLSGWTDLDEEEALVEWTEDVDGTPVIRVRDTTPVSGSRRFFRVSVLLDEE